jgi:DNA-binding NarL/FixJ family response regulator
MVPRLHPPRMQPRIFFHPFAWIPASAALSDMPRMRGLEAASRIIAFGTRTRILIFTMHESQRIAVDVRESGAHGFVQKSQAARDLILAVERLLTGGTFFGNEPTDQPGINKSDNPKSAAKAAPDSGLTFCNVFSFARSPLRAAD